LSYRVFDWDKAARLIREKSSKEAMAGLLEDWFYTADIIFANGAPNLGSCAYLESIWATPVLRIDGIDHECWVDAEVSQPEAWNWPDSSVAILKGDTK
jgi:hypothetical protein